MSVQEALEKFCKRQLEKDKKLHRKNNTPEKDFEKIFLKFAREKGFDLNVVESKNQGAFNTIAVKAGFTDIAGNNQHGHACFIELKAFGKRHSLRENQREFIIRKIKTNAFACVTDSIEHFERLYWLWKQARQDLKQQILLDDLPAKREQKNTCKLFED